MLRVAWPTSKPTALADLRLTRNILRHNQAEIIIFVTTVRQPVFRATAQLKVLGTGNVTRPTPETNLLNAQPLAQQIQRTEFAEARPKLMQPMPIISRQAGQHVKLQPIPQMLAQQR